MSRSSVVLDSAHAVNGRPRIDVQANGDGDSSIQEAKIRDANSHDPETDMERPKTRVSRKKLVDESEKLVVDDLVTSITRDIKTKVVGAIVRDTLGGGSVVVRTAARENRRSAENAHGTEDNPQNETATISRSLSAHKLLGDSDLTDHGAKPAGNESGRSSGGARSKKLPSFRKVGNTSKNAVSHDERPISDSSADAALLLLSTVGALDKAGQALAAKKPSNALKRKRPAKSESLMEGVDLTPIDGEPAAPGLPPPKRKPKAQRIRFVSSAADLDAQTKPVAPVVEQVDQVMHALNDRDLDEELEERTRSTLSGLRARKRACRRKEHVMSVWRETMTVSLHEDLAGKEPVCTELEGFPDLNMDDEDTDFAREVLKGWVSAHEDGSPTPLSESLMDSLFGTFRTLIANFCIVLVAFTAIVAGAQDATADDEFGFEAGLRAHVSGAARTEGYYQIPPHVKATYLPKAEPEESKPVSNAPAAKSSSRSQRNDYRTLARGIDPLKVGSTAATESSDAFKFNQLKTRKKRLKFGKSPIHDWGLFAMEKIEANGGFDAGRSTGTSSS